MLSHSRLLLPRKDQEKLQDFIANVDNPEFRAKLTPEEFNAVGAKLSIASMLLFGVNTLALLVQYPELIKLISAESLNAELPFQRGKPILAELCSTVNGINFLAASEHLLVNIHGEVFNRSNHFGGLKDGYLSAATMLISRKAGQELLLQFPLLRAVISKDELAKNIFDLVRYSREFLLEVPDLCEKISAHALNDVQDATLYPGYSVLTWLCCTEGGQLILFANPSLLDKVSAEALNRPVKNNLKVTNGMELPDDITPALGLESSELGRTLLLHHDAMRKMISEATLHRKVQSGSHTKIPMHTKISISLRSLFCCVNSEPKEKREHISRGLRK